MKGGRGDSTWRMCLGEVLLYYAGNTQNKIKLEPQKHKAVLFTSQKAAEYMVENLAKKYLRDDFSVVQQHG
ncbi:Uncharacterised protein [Bartonella quintana]|nr:hypothetical protein [Bartonella quintana]ETS12473.1 hypothetical protein Q651_00863 [Bartonella quintana BQ2-D70]KEC61344.1 hypothetical protein O91_00839 [Bartonella quintana JK 31]SQF96518.1 Uncharacterised protein [Bartonella quintana]